jgi:hypothetical protein
VRADEKLTAFMEPKSAIRHVRCTQEREAIPLPPGAPQGEAGWKPRDWLATRSIPLQ